MNGGTQSALRATLEKEDAALRDRLPVIAGTAEGARGDKIPARKAKPERPKAERTRSRKAKPEKAKLGKVKLEKARLEKPKRDKRVRSEMSLGAGEVRALKRLRAELKERGIPVSKSALVRAAVSSLLRRCAVAEVAMIVAGLPALEGRAAKEGRKRRRSG